MGIVGLGLDFGPGDFVSWNVIGLRSSLGTMGDRPAADHAICEMH
ncbi:hypothetical protein RISK_000838 [Rhodopirellula islandica]|uniref:Uncharacterized protein n=1 Tax=Rhodopirellula islandica TaxID=595434 RepID=A0A0J1BKK4_RHOIS|nr:hypothetical protein RISK_000838 [Rhodopirellula islandica]